MKTIIILSVLIMTQMFAFASFAGLKVEVSPSKTSFSEGDVVAFNYTISSDSEEKVTFRPQIRCSGNMPSSFIEWKTADVGPATPFKATYHGAKVQDAVEPQECAARIIIGSPQKATYEKKFQVTTKPSIDLVFNTCRDSECKIIRSTFNKGDTVYLSSTSKASPTIAASVIFPDQTRQAVNIPDSFVASQPGKYKIEISASKEGYKKYFSRSEISVIEAPYTIPYANFSSKSGQPVTRPAYEEKTTETRAQSIGRALGCSLIRP